MHPPVREFVAECLSRLPSPKLVLEVGSLYVNGSIRDLFPSGIEYVGLDLVEGRDVDIVADAVSWEPDRAYDLVVSTEVLEHAPEWSKILDTIYRACRPGGAVVMTFATTGRGPHNAYGLPLIEEGEYYRNVGLDEFASWVEGKFLRCEIHKTDGADIQFLGIR